MSDLPERWRPIPGFEGFYEVSDRGRVWSVPRTILRTNGRKLCVPGRYLRQPIGTLGYPYVGLRRGRDESVRRNVHALVLEAHVGPRPTGAHACHADGDPRNNSLSNLRWDAPAGNVADTARHGRNYYANRTRCVHNHLFEPPNLSTRGRQRHCRSCERAGGRVRKAARLGKPVPDRRALADEIYRALMSHTAR